jgi:hypothetical protein
MSACRDGVTDCRIFETGVIFNLSVVEPAKGPDPDCSVRHSLKHMLDDTVYGNAQEEI